MATKIGWGFLALSLLLLISFVATQRFGSSSSNGDDTPLATSAIAGPERSDIAPSEAIEAPTTTTTTTTTTVVTEVPRTKADDILLRALALATATERTVPTADTTGCVGACPVLGFQDLSNQQGVTLENVAISNPGGRCLDLTGASDITIRNVTITECGTEQATDDGYSTGMIAITDAQNITIENSIIRDISNEDFGSSRNNAIEITDSSNVTVRESFIADVRSNIEDKGGDRGSRAIVVIGSSWDITIDANRFFNAGRNAVQLSRVQGGTGISISNNLIDGRARWDSDYEDMISLFSASGTAESPIRVMNNTLRNGGPSQSGTGIILGDGNSSSGPTAHVVVEDNVFINPGHVGINLAGGNNITVADNLIVGIGEVPHPTTVGMTINDFGYSEECRDHVVTGNEVWMENQHRPDGTNHVWNPGTCTDNVLVNENLFGG